MERQFSHRGDRPALAELVTKRAAEATNGHARAGRHALLLMAHGSPDDRANASFRAIATRLAATGQYAAVAASFMELNEPSIPQAVDQLVMEGMQQITAVPFFLQLGGHVAEDLPQITGAAHAKHPDVTIKLAGYLGYDPLLARVIADRVREACEQASCPKRP
jgi:sirohydrochlorin cobaltochelatase